MTDTPSPDGEAMILLEDVDKHFGDFQALKGVNLRVDRREVVNAIFYHLRAGGS